jgi:chromosome partitioning protein
MTKIISISKQKGGVAKTTTTQSMGAGLKLKGFKVLMIDLDPQTNLSSCLKANLNNVPNIFDLLINQSESYNNEDLENEISNFIQTTHSGDIIPATNLLSTADMKFMNVVGREELLKDVLEPLKALYDFILIDTPPALSILTINAFAASNMIIIPMRADEFSLEGLSQLCNTVKIVRKRVNKNLKIAGILLTIHNPRTALSKALTPQINTIAKKIESKVFNTFIRQGVSIQEAQLEKVNILQYSPKATAQKDYKDFIDEFLQSEEIDNG